MASSLIVDVVNKDSGQQSSYTFARSPVRIGRSPLNDLPLELPFVSHCHGVLHFDERRCQYVDLGSTNGSFVGEQRLDRNVPVGLSAGTGLQIGTLELRARHGTSPRLQTRGSYAFKPSMLHLPVTPQHAPSTSVDAGAVAAAVRPAYAQYRGGWSAVMSVLRGQFASMQPHERRALAGQLLREFPDLAQEAEFRRLAGEEDSAASPTAEDWSSGALTSAARGQRLAEVTQRMADAFLELRRGHEQFLKETSIAVVQDNTPVTSATDAASLLRYLLDGPDERVDELNRAYADLMLHQVALINAITEGARGVLEQVSPNELSRHGSGFVGWLGRVLGQDRRWHALQARIQELSEEKTLASELFGRAFGRAYAAVIGRSGTDPGSPSQSVWDTTS